MALLDPYQYFAYLRNYTKTYLDRQNLFSASPPPPFFVQTYNKTHKFKLAFLPFSLSVCLS